MITWTKRLLLTCTILGLLATNVLTFTSAAFNAALSVLMSTGLWSGYSLKNWCYPRQEPAFL